MKLLPTPVRFDISWEMPEFQLSYQAYLVLDSGCSRKIWRQAKLLQEKIFHATGFSLHLTKGKPRAGDVFLCCEQPSGMEESGLFDCYRIRVSKQGITLCAGENAMIWAIQTLGQILKQCGAVLPQLVVEDGAALQYRGFYHDITRGRVPTLSYLKELADKLSEYKINQLQLYIENTYLFRDFSEVWRNDDPLTPEEILELDSYCDDRGIELVPSISTFSHLYQVLRTRQFSDLCELNHPEQDPFDAWDKQDHHTLDITNPDSFSLVCRMIDEYRPLFRTNRFNLCADETFDLGRGKSREYCERVGKDKAYIGFVKKLCAHLTEMGCQPMMWGDIIGKYPSLVQELPKEMVYLNWGYSPRVKEDESRQFAESGAVFYNCPGVLGWSSLVNHTKDAYQNIRLMAQYAHRFGAVGLLNTDWGDFHHVCHPRFSMIGMIYGAQFSWSRKELSYEELNHSISLLEFGAGCEEAAGLVGEIDQWILYSWMAVCVWQEYAIYHRQKGTESVERFVNRSFSDSELPKKVEECEKQLRRIQSALLRCAVHADETGREWLNACVVVLDGCCLMNRIGAVVACREFLNTPIEGIEVGALAQELEEWFFYYKRLWRSVSKESELGRIADVICWYADYLRDIQQG